MRRFLCGVSAAVFVVLSTAVASAQTTGSINGAVADNTGAMLPGCHGHAPPARTDGRADRGQQ